MRLLIGLSGCVLLYAGAFLYENEERQVQSVLETWWIRVNDASHRALSWHVSLMKAAANLATTCLDRLFGKRMLSLQAVGVSGCLSLVSLHLVTMLLSYCWTPVVKDVLAGTVDSRHFSLFKVIQIIVVGHAVVFKKFLSPLESVFLDSISFFALGAVISAVISRRFRPLPMIVFSLSMIVFVVIVRFLSLYRGDIYLITIWAISLGVICDIVAIILTRQMIRLQAVWTGFWRLIGVGIIELLLASFLLIGPFIIGLIVIYSGGDPASTIDRMGIRDGVDYWWRLHTISEGVSLSATTNIISAGLALSFFASLMLLMAHRMIWPVVDRPLYRVARFGPFRNKMSRVLTLSLGIALLDGAFHPPGSVLGYLKHILNLLGAG